MAVVEESAGTGRDWTEGGRGYKERNGTRGEEPIVRLGSLCADLERRGRRVAHTASHKKGSLVVAWVLEGESTFAINNIYQPPDHPIVIVSAHPNLFHSLTPPH